MKRTLLITAIAILGISGVASGTWAVVLRRENRRLQNEYSQLQEERDTLARYGMAMDGAMKLRLKDLDRASDRLGEGARLINQLNAENAQLKKKCELYTEIVRNSRRGAATDSPMTAEEQSRLTQLEDDVKNGRVRYHEVRDELMALREKLRDADELNDATREFSVKAATAEPLPATDDDTSRVGEPWTRDPLPETDGYVPSHMSTRIAAPGSKPYDLLTREERAAMDRKSKK